MTDDFNRKLATRLGQAGDTFPRKLRAVASLRDWPDGTRFSSKYKHARARSRTHTCTHTLCLSVCLSVSLPSLPSSPTLTHTHTLVHAYAGIEGFRQTGKEYFEMSWTGTEAPGSLVYIYTRT